MNEFLFNLLVHTFSTSCNKFSITGKIHVENRPRVSFQCTNHPRVRELLLRFAPLLVFSTFVATTSRPNRSARRISWFFELHFIRFYNIWKDKYITFSHCTLLWTKVVYARNKYSRIYHPRIVEETMKNKKIMKPNFFAAFR